MGGHIAYLARYSVETYAVRNKRKTLKGEMSFEWSFQAESLPIAQAKAEEHKKRVIRRDAITLSLLEKLAGGKIEDTVILLNVSPRQAQHTPKYSVPRKNEKKENPESLETNCSIEYNQLYDPRGTRDFGVNVHYQGSGFWVDTDGEEHTDYY